MTEQLVTTRRVKPSIKVEKTKTMFGKHNGYKASFCGWECLIGKKTPQAAQDALVEILERASDGDYAPEILEYRGHVMLMARHPVYGWGSRNIGSPEHPIESDRVMLSSGNHHCRSEFRNECLFQLAMWAWKPGDSGTGLVLSEKYQREFESWMEFQNRYIHAVSVLSYSDCDAHDYAGRNPAKPELWRDK